MPKTNEKSKQHKKQIKRPNKQQTKGQWVERSLINSLQEERGASDALREKLAEIKEPTHVNPSNHSAPLSSSGGGISDVPQDAGGEPLGKIAPIKANQTFDTGGVNPDFRICLMERFYVPKWLSAVGGALGVIAHKAGASLKTSIGIGIVGGGLGLLAVNVATKVADAISARNVKVTSKVPKRTMGEMIKSYNEGLKFDPLSLYWHKAVLVGQLDTKEDESRPPHHQASKCQKRVPIQQWKVSAGGRRRTMLVNGDLFAELLAQNHSKISEAMSANISARTANPAEYNLSAAVQSIVNADTAELARLFLTKNFL